MSARAQTRGSCAIRPNAKRSSRLNLRATDRGRGASPNLSGGGVPFERRYTIFRRLRTTRRLVRPLASPDARCCQQRRSPGLWHCARGASPRGAAPWGARSVPKLRGCAGRALPPPGGRPGGRERGRRGGRPGDPAPLPPAARLAASHGLPVIRRLAGAEPGKRTPAGWGQGDSVAKRHPRPRQGEGRQASRASGYCTAGAP